jgi:hypothetical protein
MLKTHDFVDISNTMIPTMLGGSAPPRLCVRELIAIKIFEFAIMTFDSVDMVFIAAVNKKFDLLIDKKFDLLIDKKFDLFIVKKFEFAS